MSDKLSALWGIPTQTTNATVKQSPPGEPPPLSTPDVAPEDYVPWGQEHTDTQDIEIRCRSGEWVQMREPYIISVEGVGESIVTLKSTSGAMTFEGRHLGELRRLIRHRKVDFIQEFDPARWLAPALELPAIERITIHQARTPQRAVPGSGVER